MRKEIKALEHEADMLTQAANQPFLLVNGFPGINGDIAHADRPAFGLLQ